MGTYTDFYISGYSLFSTKSDVDFSLMTIFREADKRVIHEEVEDDQQLSEYRYVTTIRSAKDRLEVMGFTLEKAKKEINYGISIKLQVLEEQISETSSSGYQLLIEEWTRERDLLKGALFEDWISAFSYIIQHNLQPYYEKSDIFDNTPPLALYILDTSSDHPFNLPTGDLRFVVRIILEACSSDEEIYQDVTELIMAGFYQADDPICEMAVHELTKDYPINEKIIILTEGSTDAHILQASLEILHPHLVEYYSFLDFGISNAAGGASSLVITIKAFIGSGIRNRVIGIFDNDTAARDAMRSLNTLKLPDNIRFFTYPDLEIAKSYPTLGPTGLMEYNINGLACSIELFLGQDVLSYDGQPQPVQWKGYNETLKQYQGEVQNKRQLQDKFHKKAELCKKNPLLLQETDWKDMRSLLRTIINAFN
ncbi:hypothetical protein EKD04_025730 [Chloroflexales bacterium ZM16-3]|nr:hypothetical protein [Chloroflexales bacterium ZM16-3]